MQTLTAAYVGKNVVDGNRASQEFFLGWEEVEEGASSEGEVLGVQTHVGQTKVDRVQKGEVKALPCTTDCTGEVELDEDGRFDASKMCSAPRPGF